jgi:hypothetical protein
MHINIVMLTLHVVSVSLISKNVTEKYGFRSLLTKAVKRYGTGKV